MRKGVCKLCLSSLDIDSVHSFRGLFRLKRNGVALVKVRELDTDERLAVKEQVFLKALAGNESKALVRQLFDCSGH